jgi:hypothetical protein
MNEKPQLVMIAMVLSGKTKNISPILTIFLCSLTFFWLVGL